LRNAIPNQARVGALREGLAKLGWTEGRELQIEYRWFAGDPDRARAYTGELVKLKPEVIFAGATPSVAALQRETRSVPIVFAQVADPVGAGFVASLARPGGNIHRLRKFRVRDRCQMAGTTQADRPAGHSCGRHLRFNESGNEGIPARDRGCGQIIWGAGIDLCRSQRCRNRNVPSRNLRASRMEGLLLLPLPSPLMAVHRDLIISLAVRHRLPKVFAYRYDPIGGGLASYGIDNIDLYRRAASYVDRILKGEKAGRLAGPAVHEI
jgi:ABC transporter substrate binding protein